MSPWSTDYWLVRFVFQRGLAVIYLLAFLVAARQFRPLAGENGLLPIDEYVEGATFRERPSLFYFVPDDRAIEGAAWTGVVLALLALFAGPYWLPAPYALPASMLLWTAMWGLYQSFVNAGRVFYGYGWESMLLETGFLAIFLGAGSSAPPVVVIWLLKWLLFRQNRFPTTDWSVSPVESLQSRVPERLFLWRPRAYAGQFPFRFPRKRF